MKALRLVWMARPGAHGLNAVLIAKTPVDDDDFLVAVTHVLLIRGVGHPGVVLGHAPRRGVPARLWKEIRNPCSFGRSDRLVILSIFEPVALNRVMYVQYFTDEKNDHERKIES